MAAVVTRKEIADKLGGEAAYFNTYGGNPGMVAKEQQLYLMLPLFLVACAAVMGVLKVIDEENLLEHSQKMGVLFEQKLKMLMQKHACIGDVRLVFEKTKA